MCEVTKCMYEVIYAWQVSSYIEKGVKVLCLDREERTIKDIGEMVWNDAVKIVNDALKLAEEAEGTTYRYEFWCKKEEAKNDAV